MNINYASKLKISMFQQLGLFLRILRGILTEVRGEGKSLNRDEVEGGSSNKDKSDQQGWVLMIFEDKGKGGELRT